MTIRAYAGILTGPILAGLLVLKYSLSVAFRDIAVLLPASGCLHVNQGSELRYVAIQISSDFG